MPARVILGGQHGHVTTVTPVTPWLLVCLIYSLHQHSSSFLVPKVLFYVVGKKTPEAEKHLLKSTLSKSHVHLPEKCQLVKPNSYSTANLFEQNVLIIFIGLVSLRLWNCIVNVIWKFPSETRFISTTRPNLCLGKQSIMSLNSDTSVKLGCIPTLETRLLLL